MAFAWLALLFLAPLAHAQDKAIFKKGDAVLTGFSGVTPPTGLQLTNADPLDRSFINTKGVVLQILDLSRMPGVPNAQLADAPRVFSLTSGQIGQVFGITMDDGLNEDGTRRPPHIYVTATSAFGLNVVAPNASGQLMRMKNGQTEAQWMSGQFGLGLGGGPGAVYKIDGQTGEVTLFATIALNGVENSGPALGNITFDAKSRLLYVSDLETGMIHRLDLRGIDRGYYDHGRNGRPKVNLQPVQFNADKRMDITSPYFNVEDTSTWQYAEKARKVWGVAVSNGRLFYSVAEGPQIWSIGIAPDGAFLDDARLEIEMKDLPSTNPISTITFDSQGVMYLAQRGDSTANYDYSVLARPRQSTTLRYQLGANRAWNLKAEVYSVGLPRSHRQTNGGVTLGYGYDEKGNIDYNKCQQTIWTTGESLRETDQQRSAETIVHGLQGVDKSLVQPQNLPPVRSWFVDFDGLYNDPEAAGHMGTVAVYSPCTAEVKVAEETSVPTDTVYVPSSTDVKSVPIPGGPNITISKWCLPGVEDNKVRCRIAIRNIGTTTATSSIGFDDAASILVGNGAGGNLTLVAIKGDGPEWACSSLPGTNLSCQIPGQALPPNAVRYIDVWMDVTELSDDPGWRYRNCVKLKHGGDDICVDGGGEIEIVKVGPKTCFDGATCAFNITLTNKSSKPFDSVLKLGDGILIGTEPSKPLEIVSIEPPLGCVEEPKSAPFLCDAGLQLQPGESKTHVVTFKMPQGLVPVGKSLDLLNCFIGASPTLFENEDPNNFWSLTPWRVTGFAAVLPPSNYGAGWSCSPFKLVNPAQIQSKMLPSLSKTVVPINNDQWKDDSVTVVCENGYRWNGEYCQAKPRCPANMVRIGSRCVCEQGAFWNGQYCAVANSCPATMINVGDSCVCPAGLDWRHGACRAPVYAFCPPNMYSIDGECVCGSGYYRAGNSCLPIRQVCGFGTVQIGNICVPVVAFKCPSGFHREGGKCVANCPSGLYWSGGSCRTIAVHFTQFIQKCPIGHTWLNGGCVVRNTCPSGQVWNGSYCWNPIKTCGFGRLCGLPVTKCGFGQKHEGGSCKSIWNETSRKRLILPILFLKKDNPHILKHPLILKRPDVLKNTQLLQRTEFKRLDFKVNAPKPIFSPVIVRTNLPIDTKKVTTPSTIDPRKVTTPITVDPRKTTTPSTIDPKKVTTPITIVPKKTTTPSTIDPKKVTTPITVDPKKTTTSAPNTVKPLDPTTRKVINPTTRTPITTQTNQLPTVKKTTTTNTNTTVKKSTSTTNTNTTVRRATTTTTPKVVPKVTPRVINKSPTTTINRSNLNSQQNSTRRR